MLLSVEMKLGRGENIEELIQYFISMRQQNYCARRLLPLIGIGNLAKNVLGSE